MTCQTWAPAAVQIRSNRSPQNADSDPVGFFYISVYLSVSLCLFFLSPSLSLCLLVSFSVSLYLSVSVSLSLSLSVCLSVSVCLCLSVSLSLSLSLSLSVSFSVPISVSISASLPVSRSVCGCVSMLYSLSLSHSLSLSISLSLPSHSQHCRAECSTPGTTYRPPETQIRHRAPFLPFRPRCSRAPAPLHLSLCDMTKRSSRLETIEMRETSSCMGNERREGTVLMEQCKWKQETAVDGGEKERDRETERAETSIQSHHTTEDLWFSAKGDCTWGV